MRRPRYQVGSPMKKSCDLFYFDVVSIAHLLLRSSSEQFADGYPENRCQGNGEEYSRFVHASLNVDHRLAAHTEFTGKSLL